jgi:hypothetical protein
MIRSRSRRLLAGVTAATLAVGLAAGLVAASPAQAAAHQWPVNIGEAPVAVTAQYATVDVPFDTDLLTINLPAGFDWAPADLAAPAPTVTWSIEADGAIVGAAGGSPAPDAGTLSTFDTTGTVDFSNLPTALVVGNSYALHINAVWDGLAPQDAGSVVDVRRSFQVTSPLGAEGNVAFSFDLAAATSETWTIDAAVEGYPVAGDSIQLSTAGAETPWTWKSGPDASNTWTTPARISGGLGTGATDPAHPTQALDGPFSISTPDPSLLVVPLPDAIYQGVNTMAITVTSRDAPSSGPAITVRLNVGMTFAGGVSGLTASAKPALTGQPTFGQTLSASGGTWAPTVSGPWATGTVALAYRWYRGASAIAGATGSAYKLTVADVGKVVTARVTASLTGYLTTTVATAGVTVRPAAAPRASVRPTIAGTASVSKVLTVRRGSWTSAPTSFRYKWFKDGVAIRGAAAPTLRLTTSLRGHRVSCLVSALRTGYVTGAASTTAVRVR